MPEQKEVSTLKFSMHTKTSKENKKMKTNNKCQFCNIDTPINDFEIPILTCDNCQKLLMQFDEIAKTIFNTYSLSFVTLPPPEKIAAFYFTQGFTQGKMHEHKKQVKKTDK